MNWLQNIPNWATAALAAAIVVPLLLLLYFLKLRRREMAVSSTLLWKKAIQDLQVNAPFQKLRQNLLLLLQLLLLLLLCIALAKPMANYTPGPGSLSVILLDRSASMSAMEKSYDGTRLDEAKRRARNLVSAMGRGDMAAVIAFDDSAQTVCPFTTDTVRLRSAIDAVQPTDRASRLKLAYKLAEAQAQFNEAQLRANVKPDVYLFSDGRVLDANELSLSAELHYEKIGTDTLNNVAIVSLSAKRNYERPTEMQIFARLANFGPEPVDADVQLLIDGQLAGAATGETAAVLWPDRWDDAQRQEYERTSGRHGRDSVEFPHVELTHAAVIRVEQMHQTGDALATDDAASVIVPPPKSLSVLLVTDGNYFLEKAINSLNLAHPDTLFPAAYEDRKPTNYDVIIFDRYAPKFVPPTGNFMCFGIVPDGLRLKAARDGNQPDSPLLWQDDVTVLDWMRDHPILRHLQLGKLYIGTTLKLLTSGDDQVLIEGIKGPLAVLHHEGRSTFLVIGFDALQSNWPLRVSFPIFMHNAMQYLAIGSDMDVRESFAPGATPRIPRPNIAKVDPNLKELIVNGPMGRRVVPIAPTGDVVLPALDKVGVYTLDPPIPQYEKLAVNLLDANESDLLPVDQPPGHIGVATANQGAQARVDLWWWIIACAALPLLMVEWWVYCRRVHL